MVKKINVDQLKPGMFINDFNCGWLEHPFLTKSLKISYAKAIKKIVDIGIREVYIDTDNGTDVADAPTREEVDKEIETELNQVIEPKKENNTRVPAKEEIAKAKKVKKEAKKTVQRIMEDVRLGRQLEIEKVDNVVEKIIDSIFLNQSALLSLGRIQTINEYTFYHSVSVGVLMIAFAKHLGYDHDTVKAIRVGGLLHDVGKINVPIEILTKPGQLTEYEYTEIKRHVEYGCDIIEQTSGISETSMYVAAHHHERFDGTGYPNNLKGERISIFGQMAAIVDVYDAITSDRCYKEAILPINTLKKLLEWSEFHFNKELVQQFIRCMGIYPVGSLVSLSNGLICVVLNHDENKILTPIVRSVYNKKSDRFIKPFDIDLSNQLGGKYAKTITGCESPQQWGIEPEKYL